MNNLDGFAVGMAALQLGMQNMITSAKQGHISPHDVDLALDGVTETLENLAPALRAIVQSKLDPQFVALKRIASENWKDG